LELTFVLPTYNRKEYVVRAIDSCLKISQRSSKIKVKVIVIDGYSNDGAWEKLLKNFSNNEFVKLLQVDKEKGFQETAFLGIDLVETDYVTFMYNDDILSDYYYQFAEKMIDKNQDFIMGYGSNLHADKKYDFKEPAFININPKRIILNYFGFFKNLEYSSLPVSPITSISKTKVLKEWINEVRSFVGKSNFRNDLFIKQNIGPDLVLFLFNLLRQGDSTFFCNSTISQLSFHEESMSILYGKTPLSSGYWLSRIWYFHKILKEDQKINKSFMGRLSAYILVSGLMVIFLNIISKRFDYAYASLREILNVILVSIKKNFFLMAIIFVPVVIMNRLLRDKSRLTPS
tara:strand:+ start:4407 stop:5441 length:1035 start_codon:yes stop_codon:yes gene_type:complete